MVQVRPVFTLLLALWSATAFAAPTLRPASHLQFPHATDSNSPGHWEGGRFYLFNSTGHPYRSYGSNIFQLGDTTAVTFNNTVNGGRWMEATWQTTNGTIYGWYHLEPGGLCPSTGLTAPRIGAAKSTDNGANWTDLGVVLEARTNTLKCDAQNGYFAGGNGDFCVMLDDARQYLYLLYSTYAGDVTEQGVAVARMAWSDRDAPAGKVWKWHNGDWHEAGLGGFVTPIFPATIAWEQADCEAFWGPSVHWNTYLQQYVMLLNRAKGAGWVQEGIYISSSTNLADPSSWTAPQKILNGGAWYPEVVGLEQGLGTDKLAGALARFFMGGVSDYDICFAPSGCPPSPCLWNQLLDGSSLPGAPWQFFQEGGSQGATVVTNFLDPDLGAMNQALRINSDANSSEWYIGAFAADEVVGGARFRLVEFTPTGKENILCVTTSPPTTTSAPAPSITLVDGRYKLWTYVDGVFGVGNPGSEIMDIGPAVTNQWHTAYIYTRKDGKTKLWWDGALIFDGTAPPANPSGGYIEWGSGSWQYDATDTVDFDWVAYGNACNLPQALEITLAGNAVEISWPTNAPNFVLQCTTNLSSPDWVTLTDPFALVNDRYTVTNDLSSASKFFRLRQ